MCKMHFIGNRPMARVVRGFCFLIMVLSPLPSANSVPYPEIQWWFDLDAPSFGSAATADIDGDGNLEIAFGTYFNDEHVYALNGLDGSILWQFGTDHPDSFGLGDMTSVYVKDDFNNDGINDVIATGSATGSGGVGGRRTVYCFDGTNGNILWQFFRKTTLKN